MALSTKNITEPGTTKQGTGYLKSVAVRAYTSHQKQSLNDNRIIGFLPMVRKIARRVTTYVKPPLSFEDLVSAGTVGLIKAARDYDPSYNAEFGTYAYIRVKGAILDELRGLSLLPPNLNKQVQKTVALSRKITEQRGTPPTDSELAERLGITMEKLYKTFEVARTQYFLSIDGNGKDTPALGKILPAAENARPDVQLEKAELIDKLTDAIRQLPDKQRQIILLYYQQELTMKQIAEVFEITESRVSQLHAAALFNLSIRLRRWKNGGQ